MKDMKIGFVGFGEAASCFAKHLSQKGVSDLLVYCSGRTNKPPYSEGFRKKVHSHGATLVDSLSELVRRSDVVFSAVVVATAADVGVQIGEHLRPGTLVVDINASTPGAKRAVAAAIAAKGGQYADANLMGAVSIYGASVPLYSSGDGVERFKEAFDSLGLKIQDAGREPGVAAAVKMLRSVVTKGIEALVVEALTAASIAGVRKEALEGICAPMDATTFSSFVDMCVRTDVLHAERRAVEMDGVAETIRELGMPAFMAEATALRLRESAAFGLRDSFAGSAAYSADQVLDAYTQAATEQWSRKRAESV